jgi:hypothetical protein
MLRIKCANGDIEIRFDHKFCGPHEIEGLTGISVDEERRCSLATIIVNGDYNRPFRGMAVCHPSDNFSRASGRKRALAHAISNFAVSKEVRTAIWEEYKDKCCI